MGKRGSLQNLVGVSLGGIGIVVCVAALIVVWIVNARLGHLAENIFGKMNQSLVAVRERVAQMQDRLQSAKITTDDVEKPLREWTGHEAGERVALRLNALEKIDRLSAILQQAGDWLEIAESSVGLVNDMLSNDDSTIDQADKSSLEQLITGIASLRANMAEATDVVTGIHERLVAASEEKSRAERIEQAAQLTVRLAATVGSIESRLQNTANKLSDAERQLQEAKARAQRWNRAASIGMTLVILWMAAGQVALFLLSWTGFRSNDGRA
jgi:DNA repair exonuclease SbcCD ATPase subunit